MSFWFHEDKDTFGEAQPRVGRIFGAIALAFVVFVAFLVLVISSPFSQNKASATEWKAVYGGGLVDTPSQKMCVAPGSRGGITVFDVERTIPADVRDYIIDAEEGVRDPGATPILLPVQARDIQIEGETVNSEGVTNIELELQAKFVFNENACLWDEKYGRGTDNLNFNAPQGEVSGWTTWLKNNLYKSIQEAARPVVKDFDWLQLSTNQEIKYKDQEPDEVFDILAREISTTLTTELQAKLGANFFCGPSYAFDGKADGKMENGTCPSIEISITQLTPQNDELLKNYEAIVANAEAQQKIESDKDRAIAQANATSEQQEAEARATSRAQVTQAEQAEASQKAQEKQRENVGTAKAQADLAIAKAQAEVARQEAENRNIAAQGESAWCRELAVNGESCTLYEAAKQGTPVVPQIVTGDSGTLFNIPAP